MADAGSRRSDTQVNLESRARQGRKRTCALSTPVPERRSARAMGADRRKLVFEHRDVPIADLACSLGRKTGSFSRLVRLQYLAPDIVAAILDGRQPPSLGRHQLLECALPTDWALQRRLLGFPPREESWGRARRSVAVA